MKNKGVCLDCKEERVIHALKVCRRCYDIRNKDKIREQHRTWAKDNPDRVEYSREKCRLNNLRQDVYERDNFQCTRCGMTQEQHLVLFNKKLIIHHEDDNGRLSDTPNHTMDNLITVCFRCHNSIHKVRTKKDKFQGLLEQDDSDYRYPKIRELLLEKKKKLGTITKAKKELAEEMGLSYHTIDHLHYERKSACFTGLTHKEGQK